MGFRIGGAGQEKKNHGPCPFSREGGRNTQNDAERRKWEIRAWYIIRWTKSSMLVLLKPRKRKTGEELGSEPKGRKGDVWICLK